jgi:uncharacterized metal-binding protein YceD (DUF177 family)
VTAISIEPEFPVPFLVERLGRSPVTERIAASAIQRAALARRMGLVALDRLEATLTLRRLPGGDIIHVDGTLQADIVQTCVVRLTPFSTSVTESFDDDFSENAQLSEEISLAMDEDLPEPIANGVIDIGELVAQYLSLSLDPYPRSPGAGLEEVWTPPGPEELSPFAVLKNLKPKN